MLSHVYNVPSSYDKAGANFYTYQHFKSTLPSFLPKHQEGLDATQTSEQVYNKYVLLTHVSFHLGLLEL